MRNYFRLLGLIIIGWLMSSIPAYAAVVVGVYGGNDDAATVSGIIGKTVNQLGKYDVSSSGGGVFTGMPFTITFDGGTSLTSGTWSSSYKVTAVAMKAGPDFLLVHYLTGMETFGDNWCTDGSCTVGGVPIGYDLGGKDLSHLSLYGMMSDIPEPATWLMMLAGFGVIGFAIRRRRALSVQPS